MFESDIDFCYESFDRQMNSLLLMGSVFTCEWEDCSTAEITMDLLSMYVKASRLCYLADIDMAIQQEDMTYSRHEHNSHYQQALYDMVRNHLEPLVIHASEMMHEGKGLQGHKAVTLPDGLTSMIPRMMEMIDCGVTQNVEWKALMSSIEDTEKLLDKAIKPRKLQGLTDIERFWKLVNLYALACYLLLHFQNALGLCNTVLDDNEKERLYTAAIQHYCASVDGAEVLEHYQLALLYNNDGKQLDIQQLKNARHALIDEVPYSVQTIYMKYADDVKRFSCELYDKHISREEFMAIMKVMAKRQLIANLIDELENPQKHMSTLYNVVFHKAINGHCINMDSLKEHIGRMLKFVDKKNMWFCVWSVLKHKNLLCDTSPEHFANQMMHPDWFGNTHGELRFNGDTIREYSGYLSVTDYTRWDENSYKNWKTMHNKKKLSDKLCEKFLRICFNMENEWASS